MAATGYDLIRGPNGALVTWSSGSIPFAIRMNQLPTLQDGSNYATSVRAAMSAWNAQVANVQFFGQLAASGYAGDGNGINEIVFDSRIYSNEATAEDFGPNVLAVTISYRSVSPRGDGTYARVESDILFNTGIVGGWNSYRGARQYAEDIRRVALHELGHVLGLNHPDQIGQQVEAIMNSTASITDGLQSDDITGAQFQYGRIGGFSSPANNHFSNATTITLSNNSASQSGSSIGANKEAGEPNHGPGEPGGASVWWKWTATANGTLMLTTAGSQFDTLLAAYTGASVNALTQLTANDDAPSGNVRTSEISMFTSAGTTYHFAVDGKGGNWGVVSLNFNFAPAPVAAPSVSIGWVMSPAGWISYRATVQGSPQPALRWQLRRNGEAGWTDLVDGDLVQGAGTTKISIATVSQNRGAELRCVATNQFGTATSDTAGLEFSQQPYSVIWKPPTVPQGIITGSDAALGVTLINSGTQPWGAAHRIALLTHETHPRTLASVPVGEVAPGQTVTIVVPFTAPYGAGSHTLFLQLTWPGGASGTSFLEIQTVGEEIAPQLVVQPQSRSVFAGEAVLLDVVALGKTPFSYQWFKNDVALAGATDAKLTLANVQESDSGSYQVLVTNALGNTWSERAVVLVRTGPAPVAVAASYVSILLRGDLTRWGIGHDYEGQVGGGVYQSFAQPTMVNDNVALIAAGENWQAHVKTDGRLWTSGEGYFGALGHGDTTTRNASTQVAGVTDVVALSISSTTMFFIKADGTLWGCGINGDGQMGDGTLAWRRTPQLVATEVQAVAAGRQNTLFLKYDGSVWGMGQSRDGRLGTGPDIDWSSTIRPAKLADGAIAVATSSEGNFYLKADGSLWRVGNPHTQIATNVARLFSAKWAYAFLKDDGTLWGAGSNQYGSLGVGHTNYVYTPTLIASNVITAALGTEHSLLVKMDGSLWAMGAASGTGTSNGRAMGTMFSGYYPNPVQILHGVFALPPPPGGVVASEQIAPGGVHLRWQAAPGAAAYEIWRQPAGGGDSVLVATVYDRLAHVDMTGGAGTQYIYRVAATNGAGRGAFSDPVTIASLPEVLPTIIVQPSNVTLEYRGGEQRFSFSVEAIGVPSLSYRWQRLVNGTWQDVNVRDHPSARTPQFEYYWGGYDLFFDQTQFRCVISNRMATIISEPARVNIRADPPEITPGYAVQVGILGQRVSLFMTTWSQTAALYEWIKDGVIVSTGPRLTIANTMSAHAGHYTLRVTNAAGVREAQITLNLIEAPAVARAAGGTTHSLYFTAEGSLWGSGLNTYYPLGNDSGTPRFIAADVVSLAVGREHSSWVTSDGLGWTIGRSHRGQLGILPPYNITVPHAAFTDAIATAAGDDHTLFLKRDGGMWGTGANDRGQLGEGTGSDITTPVRIAGNVQAITSAGATSLYIDFQNRLWALGDNSHGQIDAAEGDIRRSPVLIAPDVRQAAAGAVNSFYVKSDGSLWGLGRNSHGQLGAHVALGERAAAPVQIDTDVVLVWTRSTHVIYLKSDGRLFALGSNSHGQLGAVAAAQQNTPVMIAAGVANASAGHEHTLWVDINGGLWELGRRIAQLGTSSGATTSVPLVVASGPAAIPSAPTELRTDGAKASAIVLQWRPIGGVTSYEIWRSTSIDFASSTRVARSASAPIWADAEVDGEKNYYYRIRSVSAGGAGEFSPIVRGRLGAELFLPIIAAQPANVVVNAREDVSFTVETHTDDSISYQWRKNSQEIVGATARVLELVDVGADDAASYDVIVRSDAGAVGSKPAGLVVTKLSQHITGFNLPSQVTLDRLPFSLWASTSSGMPTQFSVVAGPGWIESEEVLCASGTGMVVVRATQPGNRHYAAAPALDRSVLITAQRDTWRTSYFTPDELDITSVSGWDVDPDGDGLSNLMEYALGLDPRVADGRESVMLSVNETEWIVTFRRPGDRSEISYQIEVSGNLETWTSDGIILERVTSGSTETWQARSPITSEPRFFRLRVSHP